MDAAAIEIFQRSHVNHVGRRLKCDGILGPQTAWAIAAETLCPSRRKLLALAQRHHGLKETGPNDDPQGLIRAWVLRCGCKPGDPWCASWAAWVLSEVLGKSLAIGGALRLARIFPVTQTPIAGDLFSYPTDDEGHGHTGFVSGTRWGSFKLLEVMTIEANHDNQLGSWRRPSDGLTFHRTIDDVSGTPPGVIPTLPLLAPRGGNTR